MNLTPPMGDNIGLSKHFAYGFYLFDINCLDEEHHNSL